MPTSLPKPDLSLRVGIVGNRNFDWLDESDDAAVSGLESAILRACEEVFASLDQVVGTVAKHSKNPARFSEASPRIKIISALAKGGDQLGTMAAMEPKGGTPRQCRFEFHGLMPFPADHYPRTVAGQTSNENFSERDLDRHDRLISKAASIVRLDGIYQKASRPKDDPNDSDEVKAAREQQYEAAEAVNRPRRYRAYRAQALMLLQHSDLVIAIWDRSAVGKSGGTEEAVIEALRVGIPVVHIQPSRTGAEIRFLFRKKDAERVSNDGIWKDPLDTAIIKLLAFPTDVPAILKKTRPGEKIHAGGADESGAEDPPVPKKPSSKNAHHDNGHSEDPIYDPEDAFAEFFLAPKNFQYRSRPKTKAAWDRFERFFRIELRKDEVIDETETKPEILPYALYRARASELSRRYTPYYRGAFFLSYLLAATAVILALLGLTFYHCYRVMGDYFDKGTDLYVFWKGVAFWCGVTFGVTKLVVIGWILRNRHVSIAEHWQERGGDFRFLSEMLRPMDYLAPLGMATPNSRPAAHWAPHDPRNSWTNWLFRAILRSQPIVLREGSTPSDYTFSQDEVNAAKRKVTGHWLPEQINYHQKQSLKYSGMFHRMEHLAQAMLKLVIAAVALHVVMEVATFATNRIFHTHLHPPGWIMMLLLLIATLFPATIAIMTGLLYQADARRQGERSKIMASQLRSNALLALENFKDHPDGCNSLHLGGEIRDEIARMMIEEVADWQLLYRMDEVKAG